MPVTPDRPCEVCGNDDLGCKRRTDGAVWCQSPRMGNEGANPPPGWTFVQGPRPASVGCLLAPNVSGMPANVEAYLGDDDVEARKAANEARAREWWEECFANVNHPRVRDYLAARGIPLERLPGGKVPKVIAFHPRCLNDVKVVDPHQKSGYRWLREPTMVAAVCEMRGDGDAGGEAAASTAARRFFVVGVHRTFLDPKEPRKRRVVKDGPGSELGEAKKMKGRCTGRAVYLGGSLDDGVIQLGEGLETCFMALAATGWYTVATLSAQGLLAWRPPAPLMESRKLHTIVIAADLDASHLGKSRQDDWVVELTRDLGVKREEAQRVAGLPTGEVYAWRKKYELEREFPWLQVEVRSPGVTHCGRLVVPDPKRSHVKAAEGKGVDWDDVGRVLGIGAVEAGLRDGIDPGANRSLVEDRRRALSGADGGGGEALPPSPVDEGLAPGGLVGEAGGRGGTRAGAAGAPLGSGGSALGGAEAPPETFAEPAHPEVPWVVGKTHDMPVIEDSPAARARRFLWERCRLQGHRRFMVVRWGGEWWVWRDGVYRKMEDEHLRSNVWAWLEGFRHMHRGDYKRLSPTSRMVEEVMKALAIDTVVNGMSLPVWASPTLSDDGMPLWGHASSIGEMMRSIEARNEHRERSADLVVARNGMLDITETARTGVARLLPHTPEFVNTSRLPYDIDVASLQRLLDARRVGGAEYERVEYDVYDATMPKFWRWLLDASSLDLVRMKQLQLMMGDTRSSDRSIEKVFAVPGVQRGGKGIIEDAKVIIMGEDNVEATSLDALEDRDGTSSLVNKAVATMSDAHLASFSQGGKSKEVLKVISGRGFCRIRDLYRPAYTVKLRCRVWMYFNEEPDLRDESGALTDRFIFWPITKSYIGKEDPSIKDGLRGESSALLNWAVLGAVELACMPRRAITLCESSMAATEEFEEVASHVRAFVRQMLTVGGNDDSEITPEELYAVYCSYCSNEIKRKPKGWGSFFRAVKLHIPGYAYTQRRSEGRKRVIQGVGLSEAGARLPKHQVSEQGLYDKGDEQLPV